MHNNSNFEGNLLFRENPTHFLYVSKVTAGNRARQEIKSMSVLAISCAFYHTKAAPFSHFSQLFCSGILLVSVWSLYVDNLNFEWWRVFECGSMTRKVLELPFYILPKRAYLSLKHIFSECIAYALTHNFPFGGFYNPLVRHVQINLPWCLSKTQWSLHSICRLFNIKILCILPQQFDLFLWIIYCLQ
jgi:hypothetical protein